MKQACLQGWQSKETEGERRQTDRVRPEEKKIPENFYDYKDSLWSKKNKSQQGCLSILWLSSVWPGYGCDFNKVQRSISQVKEGICGKLTLSSSSKNHQSWTTWKP